MTETSKLIRKLQSDLRRLQRIPAWRREAELADVAEEIVSAMLADLYAGRPLYTGPRR